MRRIAVTGHVHLGEDVAVWVRRALAERLAGESERPVHGITCLAKGADQLFARAVLELDGTVDVVLPARDYLQYMEDSGDDVAFRDLLDRATEVRTMPFERSSREAYLAASEDMLKRCDLLLAIWDGAPTRRVGDTAHVVERAHDLGVPVERIWPPAPAPAAVTPAGAPGPG